MPVQQNKQSQSPVIQQIKQTAQSMFGRKIISDTPTDSSQVANKGYVDQRTYAGYVTNTGVIGSVFPIGWSVNHPATGEYVITHNLNNNSYTIVATPAKPGSSAGTDAVYGVIVDYSPNSFTIEWAQTNIPTNAINTDFNFLMTYIP